MAVRRSAVGRRSLLMALAVGVVGAAGGMALADENDGTRRPAGAAEPPEATEAPADPPPITKHPVPEGAIYTLPGDQPTLLIGMDDGVSTQAVLNYCQFASDTGLRFVFFANGCYDSWYDARPTLGPLLETGQIQLANHTLTHPQLTSLSDLAVAKELSDNRTKLKKIYGIDVHPWMRPPYGLADDRVQRVIRAEGYHPPVQWADAFGDWEPMTTEKYVAAASRAFQPRNVFLGHLNKTDAKDAYPQLVRLIRDRGLRTVTLDDVFA